MEDKTIQNILIYTRKNDVTVDKVIDWLYSYYGKNVYRINNGLIEFLQKNSLLIDVSASEISINQNNINAIWLRKNPDVEITLPHNDKTQKHIEDELNAIKFGIFAISKYSNKHILGTNATYNSLDVNKIQVLLMAKQLGLNIPPSIISNTKENILNFIDEYEKVVTKPAGNSTFFRGEGFTIGLYVNIFEKKHLEFYDDTIFPAFIQKGIEKEYELRIFYLAGRMYSCAIFSQSDKQTSIDYRDYNNQKPNRFVPYNLPKKIEKKLHLLMKSLSLNTGSIDMIKDKDGTYIFLEINPVGYFDMISHPCNYYLEEEVAKFLINEEK